MKTSKEMMELSASIIVLVMGDLLRNLPIQIIGTVLILISLKRVKNRLSKTEKYLIYAACTLYICSLFLYLL